MRLFIKKGVKFPLVKNLKLNLSHNELISFQFSGKFISNKISFISIEKNFARTHKGIYP